MYQERLKGVERKDGKKSEGESTYNKRISPEGTCTDREPFIGYLPPPIFKGGDSYQTKTYLKIRIAYQTINLNNYVTHFNTT